MSHFPVLVLHRENQSVDELLAPFDAEREGPEREELCHCVEQSAWHQARLETEALLGPPPDREARQFGEAHRNEVDALLSSRNPDILRAKQLNEEWLAIHAPWQRAYNAAVERAMASASPDPDCTECEGTGRYLTTENPKAKWDWYVVGGRFTGVLDGYDPAEDPENWETCDLCQGTGQRKDLVVEGGCSRCYGRGRALKDVWKPHSGDTCPVSSLPPDYTPYAVVAPTGDWYESTEPGFLGMVWEEQWMAQVRDLLQQHSDCRATIVDIHM
jgi:hypothetical protein